MDLANYKFLQTVSLVLLMEVSSEAIATPLKHILVVPGLPAEFTGLSGRLVKESIAQPYSDSATLYVKSANRTLPWWF